MLNRALVRYPSAKAQLHKKYGDRLRIPQFGIGEYVACHRIVTVLYQFPDAPGDSRTQHRVDAAINTVQGNVF